MSTGPAQYTNVVGTGTPPTTPNFGIPRFSANDPADYYDQTNGVSDTIDAQAAKRGAIVDADLAPNANLTKTKMAPLDIVDSDVDPNAGIQESKLSLASDAAPGTPSRRSLGQGANQACAGNDPRWGGSSPIGTITPYSGSGDPSGGNWIIADGRLIDRTQYATFFAITGHAYNGGVDPGGNKVKIPDKRGKSILGAINMGTGAGLSDNAHAQVNRGQSGGEVVHTLTNAEMPVHSHAGVTAGDSPDHSHSGTTGVDSPDHAHAFANQVPAAPSWGNIQPNGVSGAYDMPYNTGGGGIGGLGGTNGASARHAHAFGTGGASARHTHVVYNDGGGAAHQNIGPYESDSYIVRIA